MYVHRQVWLFAFALADVDAWSWDWNWHPHDFEALEHLGANSPWFPGPNVFDIAPEVPSGCTVDQAAYIVRHGSRYPDAGAYAEWTALYNKIQNATFTARDTLAFLPSWKPVLSDPSQQIAQVSPGGYAELYALGAELRTRYAEFYKYNTPFLLWANDFPRTIDSARLFARGYMGPNASLADIHAVNSKASPAVGNSLATSDSCPTFKDSGGGTYASTWDSIYLPPIARRLNSMLNGSLALNTSDLSIFPYLCGFESQITGRRSPWCEVFTKDEIEQYGYRQDLRYWYGTGLGAGQNANVMLPVLQGVLDLFATGPGVSAKLGDNGTVELPKLLVALTHDNQINELAAVTGVFDQQKPLAADKLDRGRIFTSSHINPMRGTVAFERLTCSSAQYVRIRVNDAVYPVKACASGPGRSCPLSEYTQLVAKKFTDAGSFADICGLPEANVTHSSSGGVTFFTDLGLDSLRVVKP